MKRFHMVWMILIAALLAYSVGWGLIWVYTHRNTVPDGAYASSDGEAAHQLLSNGEQRLTSGSPLPLGGLSIDAALQRLNERSESLKKLSLTLEANGTKVLNKTWTLEQLGLQIDTKNARAAIARLGEGRMWDKAIYRWSFPDRLDVSLTWNSRVFEKAVRSQWGYLDASTPINASREITSDDQVVYKPHQNAYRLNMEALLTNVVKAVEAELNAGWGANAKPISLPLAISVVHPNVTLERLKAEGIERMITSFSTDFRSSGEGRVHNVTATANTLHDWKLAPGEEFDYRKVIEATRVKYGFREAPVILNGELVPGIGGGICQVSSTLYSAALRIGLHMTERRNHSLPVSYLPKGQDATFAEGAINFKFKNTTGKHLIIRTEVRNRILTIKLFGSMPKNVRYTIDSKTVKVIDPPVKLIESAAAVPGGRLLISTGKAGYVVETYRTKYQDDRAVSRERISRDTYKAQPAIYGVAPENGDPGAVPEGSPPPRQLIEDGVNE
ncbi:VanW family protein [Paenibacillus spongiae]|uniref:VanW family protein n=1 Tax=Paenibacillus spongiae TaxID=2909671 RepID=A0ABY5S834_9BACL|nr:VanW family protein [Paenibacillus spongiae]UVI29869.1 VanW family protein [Paenibacillus spongiae]